jgi:hypothetical protein
MELFEGKVISFTIELRIIVCHVGIFNSQDSSFVSINAVAEAALPNIEGLD